MRDTRKNREYFDEFIKDAQEALAEFEQDIKDGSIAPDRIADIQDYILIEKIDLLIARYSRGDDIALLRGEIELMADDLRKWWDTDAYTDNIRFASMAYLFGTDEKILGKIRESLCAKNDGRTFDRLIDFILTGNKGSGQLAWEKSYHLLAEAIASKDAQPLKTYLGRWYSSNRGSEWYDTHKEDDEELLYCGYWCFEAAAVAKRAGIDDALIRDNKYYPSDLTGN